MHCDGGTYFARLSFGYNTGAAIERTKVWVMYEPPTVLCGPTKNWSPSFPCVGQTWHVTQRH
jgi:hypothetical protein